MDQYMLLSERGINPPQYIHLHLDLAVAEAKRLSELSKCSVRILKVIGEVTFKDIPVVERKQVVIMADGYDDNSNDLPF